MQGPNYQDIAQLEQYIASMQWDTVVSYTRHARSTCH